MEQERERERELVHLQLVPIDRRKDYRGEGAERGGERGRLMLCFSTH